MQKSDEDLQLLPSHIQKLVAEYVGNFDDPLYKQRLNDLAILINQHCDDTWVNISASTISQRDKNLETIESFLDEASSKNESITALKACYVEITLEATQHQIKRQEALDSIPAEVWTSKVLPNLDIPSALSFSLGCKFFNRVSKPIFAKKKRAHLVNLLLANETSEVTKLLDAYAKNDTIKLTPGLYQDCIREHSPFYIAAMDRNKPIFDLLASRLPQQKLNLYELVYLVISNQGEMQGQEWKFEVETYLQNNKPSLIFEPGPDGLSPLQIAAADKDIHMLLALLKPLTNNPEKLEKLRANHANNELTLKEQWEMCVRAQLEDLPSEVQSTTLQQFQAVQANRLQIEPAPYTTAYNIFDKSLSDETWYAIGKLQRTMPLHARADVYFHSYGSNNPGAGAIPCYYERCGSRALRFGDTDLSAYLSDLGNSFSIGRGAGRVVGRWEGGGAGWASLRWAVVVDSLAISRHFAVKTQQLDFIVNALDLLLQNVNNIGPASQ